MKLLRQRWFVVFVVGVLLLIATLQMLNSGNAALSPAAIILGAFIVPVTFVTYIGGYERRLDIGQHKMIPPSSIVWSFLIGGLIGVVTAGILEFATLRSLGIPQLFGVGFIEESVKLIIPVVIFIRGKYKSEADGLLFGIASGMGFAALETVGYGFTTFMQSQGNVGAVQQVLLFRGILSPAGHAAWTGLVCATLWRERSRVGHGVVNWVVAGTFVLAIVLHASWDMASMTGVPMFITILGYLVIATASLSLLIHRIREAHRVVS